MIPICLAYTFTFSPLEFTSHAADTEHYHKITFKRTNEEKCNNIAYCDMFMYNI